MENTAFFHADGTSFGSTSRGSSGFAFTLRRASAGSRLTASARGVASSSRARNIAAASRSAPVSATRSRIIGLLAADRRTGVLWGPAGGGSIGIF
nr:hypothetical protein [Streptomyces sp. NRRL S-241]